MTEETYYKKVLISSGEVPSAKAEYNTSLGKVEWKGDHWNGYQPVQWWLKPAPSPQQEAVEFGRNLLKYCEPVFDENGLLCWKFENELFNTEELYDKFKEKGESK